MHKLLTPPAKSHQHTNANILQAGCLSCCPTNSVEGCTEGQQMVAKI